MKYVNQNYEGQQRAAMCIENIFFKAKKLQMKLLLGQSQIALRKCKLGNRTLTAGQLKTPEGLHAKIVQSIFILS